MNQASPGKNVVIATVLSVVRGRRPYAIATSQDVSGTVTFSLGQDDDVWQDEAWPEHGIQVVLGDLRKKGGWRAFKARFLRPGDEESEQLNF